MRAFDDLVRQGKILYVGVSDIPAWVVAKANTLADLRGWTPFVGLQIEYSLIERTPERELLPMAADLGLGVTLSREQIECLSAVVTEWMQQPRPLQVLYEFCDLLRHKVVPLGERRDNISLR